MSDAPQFPAFYYGPKGEAEVFQTADAVPEGWKTNPDHHKTAKTAAVAAAQPAKAPAVAPAKAPVAAPAAQVEKAAEPAEKLPLTREQIISELGDYKVTFNPESSDQTLYDLLVDTIDDAS